MDFQVQCVEPAGNNRASYVYVSAFVYYAYYFFNSSINKTLLLSKKCDNEVEINQDNVNTENTT